MKMQKLIIEDCLQLVEFFKTLGDFTRLRIVLELKTKRCVGELAEESEMSHSAVSHQLNILKANGIVKSQRKENIFTICYKMNIYKILLKSVRLYLIRSFLCSIQL